MKGPTWREKTGARLSYERYRLHNAWLRLTGRCPECRKRRGQHKFGCSRRPGRGTVISMVRESRGWDKTASRALRDHIADLEEQIRHLQYLEKRNEELEEQIRLAAGKQEDIDTNVRLEQSDISIALPRDAMVEFGGIFSVCPGDDPDAIQVILTDSGRLSVVADGSYQFTIVRVS